MVFTVHPADLHGRHACFCQRHLLFFAGSLFPKDDDEIAEVFHILISLCMKVSIAIGVASGSDEK